MTLILSRRNIIKKSVLATAAMATKGLFADYLSTEQMIEGPFYPDKYPLDTDNDLLILNDSLTPGIGQITHLTGRVLTETGEPARNAFVEIWQCDNEGNYLHGSDPEAQKRRDKNFQSYGRFLTNSRGEYYFRTIKPVPYTDRGIYRTPHIHFAVSMGGSRVFTTQMLINGHPDNNDDILFRGIADPLAQETLLVDFNPIPSSKLGELSADFDIVLGHTVEEREDGSIRGLGKPLGDTLRAPQ